MRQLHVITPGDHYSPRTGSAVPTVVHGICAGLPETEPTPGVLVAAGTYPDRYPDAEAIEYAPASPLPGPLGRLGRYLDVPVGLVAGRRPFSARAWAAALAAQRDWEPAHIIGHNAPQLPRLVDADRHRGVLYAHNHVLRSYGVREAGRALDRVHRIVAVSDALAGELSRHLPARLRARLVVVRNGVDNAFFARPEEDLDRDGPLRVAFIGRMIPDKGADVLLAAVGRMRHRADVRLTLVGSSGFSATDPLTAFEERIRRTAAADGPRVNVRPFVPRDRLPALLHAADVIVVPSRWPEPFALTVLEGMAAGAALVASDIGGIPEAAGGAALLVPPNDPDALAEALDALAADEGRRRHLVTAALAHARSRDWSVVGPELAAALGEES